MWSEKLHWVHEMRPKWPLIGVSNLSCTLCIGVLKLTKYKEERRWEIWLNPLVNFPMT